MEVRSSRVAVPVQLAQQVGAALGGRDQVGRSSSTPASASAAMARPFQAATTLSSRPGCGRCARTSSSRAQTRA
jgi:hypothetical protein